MPKRVSKKVRLVIVCILLVIFAVGAVYVFVGKDKDTVKVDDSKNNFVPFDEKNTERNQATATSLKDGSFVYSAENSNVAYETITTMVQGGQYKEAKAALTKIPDASTADLIVRKYELCMRIEIGLKDQVSYTKCRDSFKSLLEKNKADTAVAKVLAGFEAKYSTVAATPSPTEEQLKEAL